MSGRDVKSSASGLKNQPEARFISYKALIFPSNGKGIYGKSLWILGSKKSQTRMNTDKNGVDTLDASLLRSRNTLKSKK